TGLVTAKEKDGSTTITAKTGELTSTYVIKVTAPKPITGITLTPPTATISSGGTVQLAGAVAPSDTTFDKTVHFSSSNDGVATVSSTGLVTAKTVSASTTVTITCKPNCGGERCHNFSGKCIGCGRQCHHLDSHRYTCKCC
ncbi:MAG: Ig-like domain-containing protein, partial [Oscillospiraceae bacterium]